MKILSLYNIPVRLEEGDYIAVEEKKNKLWIRTGDNLYTSCGSSDKLNLDEIIYVNSAGLYSRDMDILPEMEWKKYQPLQLKRE